jgi:hypothetical protein
MFFGAKLMSDNAGFREVAGRNADPTGGALGASPHECCEATLIRRPASALAPQQVVAKGRLA